MTEQQTELRKVITEKYKTAREISRVLDMNLTRAWRVFYSDSEMTLSEYLKALKAYKKIKGWDIGRVLFFVGVDNG